MLDSLVTNIEEIIAEVSLRIDSAKCNIRAIKFDTGDTDNFYEGQIDAYCSMIYYLKQLIKDVKEYSYGLEDTVYELEIRLDEAMDRLEREEEE